jgi:hypothetical protein
LHHVLKSFRLKEVFILASVLNVELAVDLALNLEVVAVLLPLQRLVFGVEALVDDALELGRDLLLQIGQVILTDPLP